MGIDEVGIDKVGIDKVGITLYNVPSLLYLTKLLLKILILGI